MKPNNAEQIQLAYFMGKFSYYPAKCYTSNIAPAPSKNKFRSENIGHRGRVDNGFGGPLQTDTTIFHNKMRTETFCKWSPKMQNKYNYGFPASPIAAGWIMDLDQYLEKMDTTTTFILIQSKMLYGPAILYLEIQRTYGPNWFAWILTLRTPRIRHALHPTGLIQILLGLLAYRSEISLQK